MTSSNLNRDHWNAISDRYQASHDPQLSRRPKSWGGWSAPESEVQALGDLTGLRVLELGCGAGQWSAALADEGVDVIGFDLSERQLGAARNATRIAYPLVQGLAEEVPFADASFDVVFCDHGGMSWGDPRRTVPEVSRVLRPSGRLVFSTSSPWLRACYDDETNVIGTTLHHPYFDLFSNEEADGATSYTLPYGEWVRLFRRNGLDVEDLIELRPSEGTETSYYRSQPSDWARRWPAESVWVTRRR
jgi:SAM-dependent methyltransferase